MVERVLLYDADCVHCTAVAREVTRQSDGKVSVRSLHDPEIRTMLNATKPGWRVRPMLMEARGDRVRVRVGAGLAVALIRVLGFRSALAVAGARERDIRARAERQGGVSRRAMLSRGALTVVAVLFGSRTSLARGASPDCSGAEPGNATIVRDSATLNQVSSNPEIGAAAHAFGEPIGDVIHAQGSLPIYIVSHPGNVYTAVSTDGRNAISFSLSTDAGDPAITWMGTTGSVWAVSALSPDGGVRTRPGWQQRGAAGGAATPPPLPPAGIRVSPIALAGA